MDTEAVHYQPVVSSCGVFRLVCENLLLFLVNFVEDLPL